MGEKQGRGGRRNAQGGDGETHKFGTDGHTDRGTYRSGAHLKSVDSRDRNGWTALHHACAYKHVKCKGCAAIP